MFYRYTKAAARIPADLDGMYDGETLFLMGGSPALRELPLDLLRKPGVITLGMNNLPCFFPSPKLWVCADKPLCFSPHIFTSPEITKFTMISRRGLEVPDTGGKRIMDCPNVFFFGAHERFTYKNFLDPGRDLVWWRSVFPIALQLAWKLGFKKVFLVGCSFNMNKRTGEQYAWKTKLTADQAQYSHNTYSRDVDRLRALLPTFARKGFEVISSTPGSRANEFLSYVPLAQAVEEALRGKPVQSDTSTLIHSSELRNLAANQAAETKQANPVSAGV
jgi:hypothetical protein